MKTTLLYKKEDDDYIKNQVIPNLEGFEITELPVDDNVQIESLSQGDHLVITYLPYKELVQVLNWAIDHHQKIVILPHSEDKIIAGSLGIAKEASEILEDVKTRNESVSLELLCCNGEPVYEYIKIGTFFTREDQSSNSPWITRWHNFIRTAYNYKNVIHQPFAIFSKDEKLIDTAAIGLLGVEHARNSVLSRQWVLEEEPGDGQFHFFIVSPRNVFELTQYIFKSIVSKPSRKPRRPDFIGYIKSHSLQVTGSGPISYYHDGREMEAEKLNLDVIRDQLLLFQESEFAQQEQSKKPKKSIRLAGLPTGEKRDAVLGKRLPWLPRATTEDFKDLFIQLRDQANTTSSYVVMLILSTVIATFGLYGNSSPVIIGAMILAPLMGPIVAFAMGVVRYDTLLLKKGLGTIFQGTAIALAVAVGISQIIPIEIMTPEIQARLSPTLLDLGIAVASGIAAAYAHAKEGVAQSLAGVAIAVALVPPLAVSGIGIGWWDWHIFSGAFLLYLTNLAGIILFAGFTFLLLGFTPFKRAGRGLLYTLFIVLLLCVPLSFSFNHIIEEARITQALEGYEMDYYTFREVKVRYGSPVSVEFKLVSPQTITNEEMKRIKEEIRKIAGDEVKVRVISTIEF